MPREGRSSSRGGGGGDGSRSRHVGGGGGGHRQHHHAQQSWAHDQAVQLLNDAKLATDATAKTAHLKELQELVLRKDPTLLRVFFQPLLELQVDPNTAVRKTIATMCEQICVKHPQYIAPCVGAIRTMLKDAVPMAGSTVRRPTCDRRCFHRFASCIFLFFFWPQLHHFKLRYACHTCAGSPSRQQSTTPSRRHTPSHSGRESVHIVAVILKRRQPREAAFTRIEVHAFMTIVLDA